MRDEAALLKALADPIRLRLVILLAIRGETCVCHLAGALDEPEYKISRHLGVLRSAGVVSARRDGAWIYYQLPDARNALERTLHECFRISFRSHSTVMGDLERLGKGLCRNEEE